MTSGQGKQGKHIYQLKTLKHDHKEKEQKTLTSLRHFKCTVVSILTFPMILQF